MVYLIEFTFVTEIEVRIDTNKRILQHKLKQTITNQRESKSKLISMNMKTTKRHASENVLTNKEVSIIRIKARFINFWR